MVTFQEGAAILPENLYDIQNVSVLTISEIQLENRNNDHYHGTQMAPMVDLAHSFMRV